MGAIKRMKEERYCLKNNYKFEDKQGSPETKK